MFDEMCRCIPTVHNYLTNCGNQDDAGLTYQPRLARRRWTISVARTAGFGRKRRKSTKPSKARHGDLSCKHIKTPIKWKVDMLILGCFPCDAYVCQEKQE